MEHCRFTLTLDSSGLGRSQEKVEDLFLAAATVSPERRHRFLDEQCAGDKQLRDAVESLLDADDEAEEIGFLESAILAASVLPGVSPPDQSQASRESPTSESLARFEVLARHDRGGLGEVYIAFDRQLKRQVAIKQIRPKWRSHEEALQRFTREAEVTGRLEHPGIVPVYAMGEWDDGCQYYAMRFIEGQTLKQVIRDHHASFDAHSPQDHMLQLRSLLNRFVDVCNTINYAHSKKVLHRDIKPSNIMVGPYGETLVVDWGLAKLLDQAPDDSLPGDLLASGSEESGSTPTVFGRTVGTPQYMSPEQATGQLDQIGVKTDVYLLGATLFQILTDQPPHYEDSAAKILSEVERGSVTPPSKIRPETPKALEAVCTKAMAADQSQRYESVADLAADVEAWLADQPVSAYHDPLAVRLGRWGRQHRSVVAGGVVAAALVVVGSILGSTIWNRERTRQLQLERERNNKEAELVANRSQRIVELAASAQMANQLSENEIRANRYSSALKILTNASNSLASESQLQDENQLLNSKG